MDWTMLAIKMVVSVALKRYSAELRHVHVTMNVFKESNLISKPTAYITLNHWRHEKE